MTKDRLPPVSLVLVARAFILSLSFPFACSSQQNGDEGIDRSAEGFASQFYASYQELWSAQLLSSTLPAWVKVARDRDSVLTFELARALSTDYEEALAFPGEIAGIDFDPFLASQDPCDAYSVQRLVETPTGFRVEVRGDCSDGREGAPDIIADVVRAIEGYRFSNFYYPGSTTDLMTILARLRDSRR